MSTELVTSEPTKLARQDEPQNMLAVVLRAVSDPTIDPARLREFIAAGKELELIQLQRDDREAKKQYNMAWAALMPKMPTIAKNGLIVYKPGTRPQPFAKWDDIHPACMPLLYEHGFAVSFDSLTTDNKLQVILVITHTGGHEERRTFALPAQDTGGAKSPGQAAASSFTLGQRHCFCKAFNVLTRGQDDDGSGQGEAEHITWEDTQKIRDIVEGCNERDQKFAVNFQKWLKAEFGVDKVDHLFQGAQSKAVFAKLSEKQRLLDML